MTLNDTGELSNCRAYVSRSERVIFETDVWSDNASRCRFAECSFIHTSPFHTRCPPGALRPINALRIRSWASELWRAFREMRSPAAALRSKGRSADISGYLTCLLYTSDAADDLTRVDLGGRRI